MLSAFSNADYRVMGQLVDEMMAHDLDLARRELVQRKAGFQVNASRE